MAQEAAVGVELACRRSRVIVCSRPFGSVSWTRSPTRNGPRAQVGAERSHGSGVSGAIPYGRRPFVGGEAASESGAAREGATGCGRSGGAGDQADAEPAASVARTSAGRSPGSAPGPALAGAAGSTTEIDALAGSRPPRAAPGPAVGQHQLRLAGRGHHDAHGRVGRGQSDRVESAPGHRRAARRRRAKVTPCTDRGGLAAAGRRGGRAPPRKEAMSRLQTRRDPDPVALHDRQHDPPQHHEHGDDPAAPARHDGPLCRFSVPFHTRPTRRAGRRRAAGRAAG